MIFKPVVNAKYARENLEVVPNHGHLDYRPERYPYKVVAWYTSATAPYDRKTGHKIRDACKTISWCKSKRQAERRRDELSRES